MAGRLDTSVIEDKDAEPSDDYYTVIDIPNVKDIYRESGWPIYLGKDMKEKINNIEILQGVKSAEEPLSVKQACDIGKEMFCLDSKIAVSVVGLFNRGKTFLLNLITGMGLPAGKKFTTKGLSIAIPHDKTVAQSLYVIDTEGSNASLSKEAIEKALASLEKESPFVYKTPDPDADPNIEFTEAAKMKKEREREYGEFYNKAKERAIVEKLATEQLLSEIILRLAEVLIVVVNEMTWDDQQFIESLSKQLATNERLKFRLIVVHNYKETTSYDEFIEMRNKYVKSCSYGEFEKKTIVGQKDPVEVFVTKSAPEILHGFLAKDGSDLGNAMNPLTIQWIQQVCNSTQRVGPAEFVPKLISCATESLGNLVNVAGNIRLHYDPSDKKFILKSISENPKLINDIVGASRRHVTIQASTFETVVKIIFLFKKSIFLNNLIKV